MGTIEIEVIEVVVIRLDAVAHHLLVTELGDDCRADALGDDVELATAQAIVDDEARKRRAIEDKAALGALTGEIGLDLSCKRGIVAAHCGIVLR